MNPAATLIIAEAGVNHDGDLQKAKWLVEAAAAAGADVVKFQTFSADRLTTRATVKAQYQIQATGGDETQHAMLSRLELTEAMHHALVVHCGECGIEFLSSPFDIDGIDLLAGLGVKRFKVPSGEITNLPYLRHLGRQGKPIILSSGMATLEEIGDALGALEGAGTPRALVTVLQCNTEYPTPMRDVNLRAMLSIAETFRVAVGYSDHTIGIEVPIAAVSLGASVIEKHLTLDRSHPGPDHAASLEPDELRSMVQAIRNIERALGDGVKRPTPSEAGNRLIARKSIVASRDIKAGDVFTADNVTTKRPGTGVSPMQWDEVVGRRAARDFAEDELISL